MMNKSKRTKAQAMVVVFIYISIVSLIGIYMMMYAVNLHNMVIREINHTKAFYAGEAALIQSFSQLCDGGGASVGSMLFPPVTVVVDAAGAPDGYTRIRATVSNWQEW